MSTATLAQPSTTQLQTAASKAKEIARRFSFLDFQEDRTQIDRVIASGRPMAISDASVRQRMMDGDYILLPLIMDWRKSTSTTGEFWRVYPRTLTDGGKDYHFIGTHVGDRTVLYRAKA